MNWQAISFDWNQVRAFLATAEEGSLTSAAQVLGATQPTVGRQVSSLEDALGLALFERVGRGLVLTEAGRDLVVHVREMADAAARVSLVASGKSQVVAGPVSITASDVMSAYYLPQIIKPVLRAHPGLDIRILASNQIQDLLRREADIAIRHVRPEQPELIARSLPDFRAGLFASPEYLEERGRPKTVADLLQHDMIGYADRPRMIQELSMIGVTVTDDQFVCASDLGAVVWEMTLQGLGIAILPDPGPVRGLERVVPEVDVGFPIWLTTHRELRTSQKIRVVFDALADALPRVRPRFPEGSNAGAVSPSGDV